MRYWLYLIPFLHQTTTLISSSIFSNSCILFHFYIKPQPSIREKDTAVVVSYSISTSNHNTIKVKNKNLGVVSYSISTSNHNCQSRQLKFLTVVSYSISTSNHNNTAYCIMYKTVVSYSISTSNHNEENVLSKVRPVVSYSISTSNHNLWRIRYYFQAHYRLNHILFFNGML